MRSGRRWTAAKKREILEECESAPHGSKGALLRQHQLTANQSSSGSSVSASLSVPRQPGKEGAGSVDGDHIDWSDPRAARRPQ